MYLRTCCACTCKDYVCIHSQPKWPCHFGSSLILYRETREKVLCYHFVTSYAMASSSYVVDTAVSGQQVGALPPDVPPELAGSFDSFQHVEAVMKEDDVSTVGMDSQDWELVTEMVAETENAATDFMQGKHVSLEAPKQDLQSSLKAMEETMANLKLGKAARGVDAPSASEGAASATAAIGAEAPSRPEGVAPVLAAETENVQMGLDTEVDPQGQRMVGSCLVVLRKSRLSLWGMSPSRWSPFRKRSSNWWRGWTRRRSLTSSRSSVTCQPFQPWALLVWSRPTLPSRHKSSMMRSCDSHMSKDVLALELEMRAFRTGLWALQGSHTSALSASLIGLLAGQWRRRRCASATRRWLPSRRQLIWQPWSRSNTGGSFLSLAMALRGCGTVPRNLKLRLPLAVTSGWNRWFRTWTSKRSMRWISVALRKLPFAQRITLRHHSRTISRALTACNLELRYSTGWWMRKHSLLLISPDLRFPRTSNMGRRPWFSIRMLRRPWRWRQSWPQQTFLRRRRSTPKSRSRRWMRLFQQMQTSSMTCRVERSRWKTLRVQRCCAALICWNSKKSWRGSFLKGQDPTRALLKLWHDPWWAWSRPRSRIGSMKKRGGSTSPSSRLQWGPPEVDWGFVFVDDFCWILRSTNCHSLTPALLAFLVALGVPLSWKKTVLSEINTWLGFVINPAGPFVQMARDKHVIVLALLKDLAAGKVFSAKAIEKALGRIQWATATCPLAKPFLQPFWQWKSACKNAGQPGKLVRCLAVLLSELFSRQFPQMSPFSPWSRWTGASDASAEPFGSTWIGGWFSDLSTPTKAQVYWFQYQVTRASHPWAFKNGDPQKRIAAIELYGTLFLVLLLMERQPAAACRLHIPLISDNQGNVYSILNNATRKMPNSVVLMELVYQIYQAGHMLAPTHSKRDDNKWADELTHPNPLGFSPALKVDISHLFAKFTLIPKLLESGDSDTWFNTGTHPWPPGARWVFWFQTEEATFAAAFGAVRAAFWNVFPLTPVRRGGVGYRGSPLHTGLSFDCDLWTWITHRRFWNQNFGTTLPQEKHAAFISFPFSWCMQTYIYICTELQCMNLVQGFVHQQGLRISPSKAEMADFGNCKVNGISSTPSPFISPTGKAGSWIICWGVVDLKKRGCAGRIPESLESCWKKIIDELHRLHQWSCCSAVRFARQQLADCEDLNIADRVQCQKI